MVARRLGVLACVFALVALSSACRGNPTTVLDRLEESRRLAADLHVKFSKAGDAANRTVMADTEQASLAFAAESGQASQGAEQDVAALRNLLRSLNYANEARILQEFEARFADYQKLDRRILALAVENTNLKAQALSFGPGTQAAAAFRDALRNVATSFATKDRCRADGLVADAVLGVREIQVLYTPHIAERDDAAMTRMEKDMADADARARTALTSLTALAPPSTRPALAEALAALDELKALSAQIVELSRRNTNLLSLDLSLRHKPALTAACDERLHALQDALAKEGPKSAR